MGVGFVSSVSPTAIESLFHVLLQLVAEGSQWTGVDNELPWRVLVQVRVECVSQQPGGGGREGGGEGVERGRERGQKEKEGGGRGEREGAKGWREGCEREKREKCVCNL